MSIIPIHAYKANADAIIPLTKAATCRLNTYPVYRKVLKAQQQKKKKKKVCYGEMNENGHNN